MIEINLLKDLGDSSSGAGGSIPIDPVDAIKKVFVVAIPIALSVGAGIFLNNVKLVKKSELQAQLDSKKGELTQLDGVITDINQVIKESEEIDKKLKKMKEIFDLRIINVKALDAIKANIPNQIFLKKLSLDTNNYTLKMSGVAESSESIGGFVAKLNKDVVFEEGNVMLDLERAVDNSIEFEVSAKIVRTKYAKN